MLSQKQVSKFVTAPMLYVGHAVSKVGKGGRIKIPESFGTVLSKNSGQLRILIGRSFTENCWICYDTSVRTMNVDQCRALIYPRDFELSDSISNLDRSILSTLFVQDVTLGYSFRLPKALAGSFFEGEQIVFVSLGYAFEIWDIDDLLKSKHTHKNLASLVESEKTILH